MTKMNPKLQPRIAAWLLIAIFSLVLLLAGGTLAFDLLRQPFDLYQEAQSATEWRAMMLYNRLAKEMPAISEYFQLEMAIHRMPDFDAITTLKRIIEVRPHSPPSFQAHQILARYYADIGEPITAEDNYRAALSIQSSAALRAELARYLVEIGDLADANSEYQTLLGEYPDSFVGIRRISQDPIQTAEIFIAEKYFSDALEVLRGLDSDDAIPLRAEALASLGYYEDAMVAYRDWLKVEPHDSDAQLALAGVLAVLGQYDQALEIYQSFDISAAWVAEANLLLEVEPEKALELYINSDDPIAWWIATGILEEQNRADEALEIYDRVARSGVYLSDDAAHRYLVLARQLNEDASIETAKSLLQAQGRTYLGLQALDDPLQLLMAPFYRPLPSVITDKVTALEELGLDEMASQELAIAARFDPRPEVVAVAAEWLAERGKISEAMTIGVSLLEDNERRPLSVWRLAYPKPYEEIVEAAANEAGIDPLLVWALMRQESRFDPEALSYVNAQGLMQVIPSTRDWIAEMMGEQVRADAMFDPETAIRFGSFYLGSLIELFEGDIELAVAAYNGGPGSVTTWLGDPMVDSREDFYRWIGFGETREFLMKVMLNYRIYQYLEQIGN